MNDNYPIPYNKSWEVLDATKLQTYLDCPRKFFFEYLLGWRPEGTNVHLVFGKAWHEAMEYLLLNGYDAKSVLSAYELFEQEYRKEFAPEDDISNGNKTPDNAFRALGNYAKHYGKTDKFDVLFTEVAGVVPISMDGSKKLHFRIDAIVRDPMHGNQVMVLEHKTGSQNSRQWHDQWALKTQVGTYSHALFYMFEPHDVYGVMINGAIIRKNDEEFVRVPVLKTPDNMNVWLWNTRHHVNMIEWNMQELSECSDNDQVLMAFPMNTESCTKYFGCPFHDFCTSWSNPLRRCEAPPIGFKQEYWDPTEQDSSAKHLIELEAKHGED